MRTRVAAAVAVLALAAVLTAVTPARSVPGVRLAVVFAEAGGTVALPVDASHLAVTWQGSEDAAIDLTLVLTGGGLRTERVLVAHDMSDDGSGQIRSGLVLARGATAVRVHAGGDARDLRVVAIDAYHRGGVRLRPRAGAADAAVDQPALVSRAEWGADESLRRAPPEFAPITRAAVHHTVTPNGDPDPAATVRAILAYHTRVNGWSDIGYNFLVDAAGRVYEGRHARRYEAGERPTGEDRDGRGVVGAHVAGHNAGSVGVALLGSFTDASPSPAALDALARLLAWKADRHGFDPRGSAWWNGRMLPAVVGHRDVGTTACPGDRLYERLPQVREAAGAIVDASRAARGRPVDGYRVVARDGAVSSHGAVTPDPAPLTAAAAPVAAAVAHPSKRGYWVAGSAGRVVAVGAAPFLGSPELTAPGERVLRVESTPSGLGYWVLTASGRVLAYGDARWLGDVAGLRLNAPVVALAASPTGGGYWLAAADGGLFAFGDAPFLGSLGGARLRSPVVALAGNGPRGYWMVTRDGGVFAFGAAAFRGSVPGVGAQARVVQARSTPTGLGYYLLGEDGAVFAFGDARFHGRPAVPAADLVLAS